MRRLLIALCLAAAPGIASAEAAWPWIKGEAFGDRPIADGAGRVALDAPARTEDDRAAPISVSASLPEGRAIARITLVIDENPSPVSAVIEPTTPVSALAFGVTFRMNGPSPVRAILEDDAGGLWMTETMVKTSGLGACAAPPGTDPAVALQTIGQMALAPAAGAPETLTLSVSHPSYSGLQMDQVTLLYRPARFIERLEAWADDRPLFALTGSISLSENPVFRFARPEGADALRVRVTDTDGDIFERRFALGDS